MNRRYTQPALIGGLVMGVLSALPLFNFCCCLWVVAGGVVAAYLLQQRDPAPITPGDGALVGLLAGLAGAFIQVALSIPVGLLVGPMERAIANRVLEMAGSIPPGWRDLLEGAQQTQHSPFLFALGQAVILMIWLAVGSIFSTLGGLLGAAIFQKKL